MARPSKFEEYKDIILGMAKYGLTDKQMADSLNITEQTINNWKSANTEFFESLKSIKAQSDVQVTESLFKRAIGYVYSETTQEVDHEGNLNISKIVTKQQAPDTTAQIFWLKNRQPDKWRDKQEIEHSGEMTVNTELIEKYLKS